MQTYKDEEGRTWDVRVNVDVIKRVRRRLDVDLLDIATGELLERLVTDPVLLVDTLYVICEPQATERGVTDEQFGQAMAGDAIEHATKALLEALVFFTPNPRDRERLHRVIEATYNGIERVRDLLDKRIETGELDRVIDQALVNVGDSSTSAPESSVSIPAT